MKALKYGLTLMLGLSMLGLSANLQAQSSGQTAAVVPTNADHLSSNLAADTNEVEDVFLLGDGRVGVIVQEESAQRGIPTPNVVNDLIINKEYSQAVEKFEGFMKTAQASPCDLAYLQVTFYDRLMEEDPENKAFYQKSRDASIEQMESKCQKMAELYILKDRLDPDQSPETTIAWMDKAISVDSHYGTSYVLRGDAHWALGQTEKACADYKKAMELNDAVGSGNFAARCLN